MLSHVQVRPEELRLFNNMNARFIGQSSPNETVAITSVVGQGFIPRQKEAAYKMSPYGASKACADGKVCPELKAKPVPGRFRNQATVKIGGEAHK